MKFKYPDAQKIGVRRQIRLGLLGMLCVLSIAGATSGVEPDGGGKAASAPLAEDTPKLVESLSLDPTPVPSTEPSLSATPPKPSKDALEILGEYVEPGTVARLVLRSSESFAGATLETPVVVVHGGLGGGIDLHHCRTSWR